MINKNMENLEVIIKEARLELLKGSDLIEGKDKIDNHTNFINVKSKETIEYISGDFVNEEGCCYQLSDIGDSYFISARQFLLTTFSNKEITNELFRRVGDGIVTELDELDEVVLGGVMIMNKKYKVTYKDSYNEIPRTEIMTDNQLLFKQCCDSNFKIIRKVEYINEDYCGY